MKTFSNSFFAELEQFLFVLINQNQCNYTESIKNDTNNPMNQPNLKYTHAVDEKCVKESGKTCVNESHMGLVLLLIS